MAILTLQTLVALTSIVVGAIARDYPISGSWFKHFKDSTEASNELDLFAKIGGDTVLLRGAHLLNRTEEEVKDDPLFAHCEVGQ